MTVDDLELRRPIRLRGLPATSGAVTTPLLFAAQEHQPFEGIDFEMSGGALTFQAYLLWAPKIAPTDHQGVMIRVHDASGTLFDPTFLRFPVAEQRRLTQITCEIFIIKGFDGALNIDRESFNFAHPHVVALTKWLHAALRRVIAVQKRIAADALEARRNAGAEKTEDAASSVVTRVWNDRAEDDGTEPPPVVFTDSGEAPGGTSPAYVLPRQEVVGDISGPGAGRRRETLESQLAKITQVLAAFDLIDHLSPREQAELITAIREILQAYGS